jgi:hypothetical protein
MSNGGEGAIVITVSKRPAATVSASAKMSTLREGSMYCPECLVSHRQGFTECADCHVPLLEGEPPESGTPFNPGLDLVCVLETCDAFALAAAKGLLDEAGIPFFVLNEVATLVNDIDPMLRKWVRIQVAIDRAEEARAVLDSIIHPEAGGTEAVEP